MLTFQVPIQNIFIYIWDLNSVNNVPADALAPNNASPLVDTIQTTTSHMFFYRTSLAMIPNHIYYLDDIQNGHHTKTENLPYWSMG